MSFPSLEKQNRMATKKLVIKLIRSLNMKAFGRPQTTARNCESPSSVDSEAPLIPESHLLLTRSKSKTKKCKEGTVTIGDRTYRVSKGLPVPTNPVIYEKWAKYTL